MYYPEHLCSHLNQILDTKEGNYCCLDCGLVLSPYYIQDNIITKSEETNYWREEIKNYLDRIHIPQTFSNMIYEYFDKNYYSKNNKNMMCSIYKILNENGITITLNEISGTSHISSKEIVKVQKDNVKLTKEEIAEKYCKFLNLSFAIVSVIKEEIKKSNLSGHTPTTIVAAIIYKITKQEGKGISMKEISKLMNVSCISIQRYIKYQKNAVSQEH
jgi:transcription initiation factor TFIIIB Brf1 subunit/transcription initiation factor TFIIB